MLIKIVLTQQSTLTSIGASEGVGPEQPHGSIDVLVQETGVGSLQELVDVGLVGIPQLFVLREQSVKQKCVKGRK